MARKISIIGGIAAATAFLLPPAYQLIEGIASQIEGSDMIVFGDNYFSGILGIKEKQGELWNILDAKETHVHPTEWMKNLFGFNDVVRYNSTNDSGIVQQEGLNIVRMTTKFLMSAAASVAVLAGTEIIAGSISTAIIEPQTKKARKKLEENVESETFKEKNYYIHSEDMMKQNLKN